ncbi:NADH:flavin oxidoreductase [Pseudomonas chlororaphis]|uniref:NADH:flavin oxidoreductase n=1 Tax=Pseudomonas chlororaphis TaxID=587753 RepID=UPI001B30D882|nr:NADH:flavin oxidoreductase [Pseudomonas chlororaphis]MBP5059203.1 NADH:flavin oxidoreductase [Pseudomonas chlororaphis]MBP5142976.1 NADH:flavin oxidoreductase [Pseudomonas chlororaphis]QTT98292.1 NADH:flavin oxidoreductase [Pseudomonas chlororaphis]
MDILFQPFAFKGLRLRNRFVMAPLTRSFSPGGVATAEVAAYYRRRAEGEVGLIISEGTGVARPAALNDPNVPRFHGEQELAAWKHVLDEVHAAGGSMAPQLWHVGAMHGNKPDWAPAGSYESPSGLAYPGKKHGMGMSEEQVADTIHAFAQAAAHAKALGFEAVELHGAHGYLIDQFFWDGTNERSDRYGSPTLPGRARFAADVIRAVRAAVGPDFPIIIRISQWKQQDLQVKLVATSDELSNWVTTLTDAGADIIHCSQRRFWESEFDGSDLSFAGWVKKLSGVPVITVGSVGLTSDFISGSLGTTAQVDSLDELVRRLERNEFDLVAVGRALLQDPNWVRKVREGRASELQDFDRTVLATLT